MPIEAWLACVPEFGITAVELYHDFLNEQNLATVSATLSRLGLKVSQITCAPDFTNPDPSVRRREQERMRQRVRVGTPTGRRRCAHNRRHAPS